LHFVMHHVPYKPSTQASVVLMILDGHVSHTKCLAVIDLASSSGVIMLSLPPHTSLYAALASSGY